MQRSHPHVIVVPDSAAAADAGARLWVDTVRQALAAHGVFHVALAGGTTPRDMHRKVSEQADLDYAWHRTHVFFGDERAVPPDDDRSNFGIASEALIDCVPLSPQQVHRMEGEAPDLAAAAERYAGTLAEVLAPPAHAPPVFDLIWLGLGTNGHTASLFPNSPALAVRDRWVVAVNEAAADPPRRLTLTVPVLNASRRIIFLVTGSEKAAIVAEVLEGEYAPDRLPAQIIQPAPGRLVWLLDEAAAARLARTARSTT